MDLPELPRKLDKQEAKITPHVIDWFDKNYPSDWFIEVKATKTNSVPISAVKPHQLQALLAIRSKKGLKHKLSDAGRVRQPFDAFGVYEKDSFVVACFLPKRVCLAIHPDNWRGAKISTPCEFRIDL